MFGGSNQSQRPNGLTSFQPWKVCRWVSKRFIGFVMPSFWRPQEDCYASMEASGALFESTVLSRILSKVRIPSQCCTKQRQETTGSAARTITGFFTDGSPEVMPGSLTYSAVRVSAKSLASIAIPPAPFGLQELMELSYGISRPPRENCPQTWI